MDSTVDHVESGDRLRTMLRGESFLRLWPAAVIAVFPAVAVLGLGFNLATPWNGVDQYIYVGAVDRLRDFLLRWPDTYYAVRFGYILPEWLFERVFGEQLGFVLLRLALLGMIAAGCRVGRRLGLGPALLGALVIVTSPVILVTVFNKYVMSLALAFLLLGASLLSNIWTNERRSPFVAATAGVALALSWNSHLVALPICLVVAGVFSIDGLVEARKDGMIAQLKLIAWLGLGTVIAVVTGMVIYRLRFGVTDLYGPTLHQAKQDTNQVFVDQHSTWITWRHFLLIGPLGICAGIAAWRAARDPGVRRSIRRLTIMTVLAFVVFAWFEWVRGDPLLSNPIYSCMPLGLALITLGRSASSFADELAPSRRRSLVVAAVLSIAAMWLLGTVKPGFAVVALAGLASIVALFYFRHSPTERFLATCSVVLAASIASVSSPHDFPAATAQYRVDPFYDRSLFAYDYSGFDHLDLADQFARSLPSLPASRGEIRVWFDSTGDMNEVVSTMVWYRSALQNLGDPPMPEMSDTVRQRIGIDRPRWVVVLDDDSDDVTAGVAKVQALGPYHVDWTRELKSGSSVAFVAMLQIEDGTWSDFPCYNRDHQAILCSHAIPITWPADVLPTVIGHRSGGLLSADSTSAAGFLSYGPYILLEPGEYAVTLNYSSTASTRDAVGLLDISSSSLEVIGSGAISGSAGHLAQVTLHFTVPASQDIYEFRTRFDGVGDLSVRSIKLTHG